MTNDQLEFDLMGRVVLFRSETALNAFAIIAARLGYFTLIEARPGTTTLRCQDPTTAQYLCDLVVEEYEKLTEGGHNEQSSS